VPRREDFQVQVNSTTSGREALDLPDANLIIQSSDLVNFRVHESVLAITSPVFKEILSRHQPSGSESVDELPVVKLTEDGELLNSLFSMLYPIRPVIPTSYEKVLYLLAACQKYDMDQTQSFIRAEVSCGSFPMPTGTEVFCAYAIASSKRLIPEMEDAARLTLDHPMTLETLGEGLRFFEASALQDLVRFRKRCRDNLVTCFKSFLNLRDPPFNIWMSCKALYQHSSTSLFTNSRTQTAQASFWLTDFFQQRLGDLNHAFTKPLPSPSNIREEYMSALQAHTTSSGDISCITCVVVHAVRGEMFCNELEDRLANCISGTKTNYVASHPRNICNPRSITALDGMAGSKVKRRKKGKKK
jgi:BTB/POZ domain